MPPVNRRFAHIARTGHGRLEAHITLDGAAGRLIAQLTIVCYTVVRHDAREWEGVGPSTLAANSSASSYAKSGALESIAKAPKRETAIVPPLLLAMTLRLTISTRSSSRGERLTQAPWVARALESGPILWMDRRGDAFPKEANKLRPGIVVETSDLYAPQFPNVLVVPCATSLTTEVPSLCLEIEPDETNGFDRQNWAIMRDVTSASKRRIVQETTYSISPEQLSEIRSQIAEASDIS